MYEDVAEPLSFFQYKEKAESNYYSPPASDDIEAQFWKKLEQKSKKFPLYAAGVDQEVSDKFLRNTWRLSSLDSILMDLRTFKNSDGPVYKGIDSAYVYCGMYAAGFPWHTGMLLKYRNIDICT